MSSYLHAEGCHSQCTGAVGQVGANAFRTAQGRVDHVCVVSEDSIALAILRLVEIEKSVVEGAGAAGLAACLAGQLDKQRLTNKK